jgi:oligopeptide/dipeptide ABC transporter ATP-binding protein
LKEKFNLTYVFISHDLAVIRHISDRVAVMYLGQVVESGTADAVLGSPAHPYTQMLMAAVLEPGVKQQAMAVTGEPPNPESPPPGCSFHPRCPHVMDICRERAPIMKTMGTAEQQHEARCWLYANDADIV